MSDLALTMVFDIAAISAGTVSIIIIVISERIVGGRVASAFSFFLLGIIMQVAAFLANLAVTLEIAPPLPFDLHNALLISGLVFFIFGSIKFSRLSQ